MTNRHTLQRRVLYFNKVTTLYSPVCLHTLSSSCQAVSCKDNKSGKEWNLVHATIIHPSLCNEMISSTVLSYHSSVVSKLDDGVGSRKWLYSRVCTGSIAGASKHNPGVLQWAPRPEVGRGVSVHPHHLGPAHQELKEPHAQWGVWSLSFVTSLEGTMVFNADL